MREEKSVLGEVTWRSEYNLFKFYWWVHSTNFNRDRI